MTEPKASGEESESPMEPADAELLAAFDRMSPQGSLRWGFDDALRRVLDPDVSSLAGPEPWTGLPDDLWLRGRSARIGQRFVGDVAGVLANLLAADSRLVASGAVAGANQATSDALRYLAARVELLEARVDPSRSQVADLSPEPPDVSEWLSAISSWLATPGTDGDVLVGESGEGSLLRALGKTGRRAQGVEPRGELAWRSIESLSIPDEGAPPVVFAEVIDYLHGLGGGSHAGLVLAGCVDRADVAGNVDLLGEALRVLESHGTLIILTTDQASWDSSRSAPQRDLARGRPLHPETWSFLLGREGFASTWHRPQTGPVHAIVARAAR